jgi:hypothetical protein
MGFHTIQQKRSMACSASVGLYGACPPDPSRSSGKTPFFLSVLRGDRKYDTILLSNSKCNVSKESFSLRAECLESGSECMLSGNDVTVAARRETTSKTRQRRPARCSVCKGVIWLRPIVLREPASVPEPRRLWVLCRNCHDALLAEMRRSPVNSPMRLRIALGLVAAERSPEAYGLSTHIRDRRRFVGIAVVLIVAMLLHLALIVALATMMK